MKSKKKIALLTVSLLLLTLLWGCLRVYPDGEKQEIGPVDKTMDIIIGKPNRPGNESDKENPDSGLLPVIVGILSTLGVTVGGHLLERNRLHRLRASAEQETDLLRAGYQEIKEGHRGDEDSLTKVKMLFNLGKKIYAETLENKNDVAEDLESFKKDYKRLRAGHRDIDKT